MPRFGSLRPSIPTKSDLEKNINRYIPDERKKHGLGYTTRIMHKKYDQFFFPTIFGLWSVLSHIETIFAKKVYLYLLARVLTKTKGTIAGGRGGGQGEGYPLYFSAGFSPLPRVNLQLALERNNRCFFFQGESYLSTIS